MCRAAHCVLQAKARLSRAAWQLGTRQAAHMTQPSHAQRALPSGSSQPPLAMAGPPPGQRTTTAPLAPPPAHQQARPALGRQPRLGHTDVGCSMHAHRSAQLGTIATACCLLCCRSGAAHHLRARARADVHVEVRLHARVPGYAAGLTTTTACRQLRNCFGTRGQSIEHTRRTARRSTHISAASLKRARAPACRSPPFVCCLSNSRPRWMQGSSRTMTPSRTLP